MMVDISHVPTRLSGKQSRQQGSVIGRILARALVDAPRNMTDICCGGARMAACAGEFLFRISRSGLCKKMLGQEKEHRRRIKPMSIAEAQGTVHYIEVNRSSASDGQDSTSGIKC